MFSKMTLKAIWPIQVETAHYMVLVTLQRLTHRLTVLILTRTKELTGLRIKIDSRMVLNSISMLTLRHKIEGLIILIGSWDFNKNMP